jgi:penicillin-binding protein 2
MIFFRRRQRSYRVSPDRDEWVTPEDTLIDSSSTLSNVELPVSETIFSVATILSAVLTLLLIMAAGRLSVVKYDYFSQIGFRNKTVNVSVPPPRGLILDRNGTPLVQNVPSFDLLVISRQVERESDGTFPGIRTLAGTLEREPEELTLALNDGMGKNAVFFLATDIKREQVLSLRTSLPAGFYLITSTKRNYIDGPQFSQVIGYVGKVSRQDMARDEYYLPSDTVGRLGVEASYEKVLRGTHGQLVFASAQNTANRAATSGGNLVLNIDAGAQKALFKSLFDILRESGLGEAAAVVQDPRNGAVLALASFPTYDNNVFNGQLSQDDFEKLFNSRQRPLFNRAIAGVYNPGSTIKPFIGMTALQEHVVTSTEVVANDCVSITVPNPRDPANPYVFKNWRPDSGPFTLRRAIAQSCNVYFFTVGGGFANIIGLGVERIISYLTKALANVSLGIDLPGEDHGFLPTPDWKYQTKKEPWYQGDTYNISIGQGDLLVTPLWINAYVSAIANGGTIWQPQVAGRVVDDQRTTTETFPAKQLGTLPFSASVIREMQAAMRQTVTDGTAHMFADLPVTAAAKTGTAEVIKGQRINSLLTVYAPAENPTIAMTILVEGSASNQGYALRAAKQFLSYYFSQK